MLNVSIDHGEIDGVEPVASSPSQTIQKAIVTLLGLSYGEHDGGVQRQQITDDLTVILDRWTSGLLAADHLSSEVASVTEAFQTLILSSASSKLLMWSRIPLNLIDDLTSLHWKLAVQHLTNLSHDIDTEITSEHPPSVPSLPVRRAAHTLKVALYLLDRTVDHDKQRRSAAVDKAPAFFVFTAVRMRISLRLYPHLSSEGAETTLSATFDHIVRMRRVTSTEQVISSILSPLISLVQKAIAYETTAPNPRDFLNPLALASCIDILYDIVNTVPDVNKLQTALPEILRILYPLIDHVHMGTRVSALDVLTILQERLPRLAFKTHLSKLCTHLPSALLWGDPPSSTRAIPLLFTLFSNSSTNTLERPPPLNVRASSVWQTALTAILKAVHYHIDQSFLIHNAATFEDEANDDAHDTDSSSHAYRDHAAAAAHLITLVTPFAQHRLLRYTKPWFDAISQFLLHVVKLVVDKALPLSSITSVSNAIVDSIAYTWCRCSAYRAPLFAAGVACIMEVRPADKETQLVTHAAVNSIISQLAVVDDNAVLKLTSASLHTARKYPSLQEAAKFLAKVEEDVSKSESKSFISEQASKPGPFLNKIFGDKW